VYLGESKLAADRDVVWRAPTMARIGITVLALDEPVSVALAELEAAADEAMREDDIPAAPTREPEPEPAPEPEPVRGPASVRGPSSAPPASLGGAAPVAEIAADTSQMTRVRRERKGWTMTDVLVFTIAVGVIAASVAGLVWVLR
jgi:hypothetical protein